MAKTKSKAGIRGAPIPVGDELGAAELAGRVAESLREHRKRGDREFKARNLTASDG